MTDKHFKSRREFLKYLGYLLPLSSIEIFGSPVLSAKGYSKTKITTPSQHWRLGQWTGDDFTRCHQLRDGKLPALPDKAEKEVDFVIVGGRKSFNVSWLATDG